MVGSHPSSILCVCVRVRSCREEEVKVGKGLEDVCCSVLTTAVTKRNRDSTIGRWWAFREAPAHHMRLMLDGTLFVTTGKRQKPNKLSKRDTRA